MYETILWATNATPLADGALAEALDLLEPEGRLIAFYCDERFSGARAGGAPTLADTLDRRARVSEQVDDLRASGVDADFVVKVTHNNVVTEIAKTAAEHDADAIVCGTRGFGVVAGAIAGSVAMRLPHVASCPVVVVSERAAQRRAARAVTT
jgi:nucleotide-binding universal stress UspA family protein